MIKQGMFILGILFILTAWAVPVPASEVDGPRILVETPEFDFNTVKEGEVVAHAFKVLNQGNEELRILSVRPG